MFECFECGRRAVIWDADFDSEECGYEAGGIVHKLHCTGCGARIEYVVMPEEVGEYAGPYL